MSPPLRRLSSSLSFAARRAFATTPARRLEGGTYGVGYSPQAVHDITPITPRAKPPPYFYLTKPGMWKAIEKLESTNEELKRRLRDAHVFPLKKGMTPYTRPPIKWRKQEEVALLLGVGT